MNTPLRRVALSVMVMVLLLLANSTYIQVIKADEYSKDNRNGRVLIEEYARQRGQIRAADGQLMATVEDTKNSKLKYLRKYPNGPMYAAVTGYTSSVYGSTQLEKAQADILNGSDPLLFGRRLSDLITGNDPRGGSLKTTIDQRIQQTAYDAMSEKQFVGAVVALRPNTGEILAMVSTPSFDPNRIVAHDTDAQKKAWAELSGDKLKPNLNRATSELYEPGSTFKMVVAAAAVENGMKDVRLTSAPTIDLPGTGGRASLSNFAKKKCGSGDTTSLEEALSLSCNTAFAELAGKLGEAKLREQAQKLGIGQKDLTVPMPVVPSTLGDIPNDAGLYQSGIGQLDVKLTPLQDAVIAATIANGGMRMQPFLVKEVLRDVSVLRENSSPESERAMSATTASTVRDMMIKSEQNTRGGGKLANVTIASKTGTAEHGANPKETKPHAWYAAFAPADNPKIAVAVLVENGGDHGLDATGGTVAAPIGRAVIGAALGGG